MWSCEEWNMRKGINISHVNIENMGGRDQSQLKIKFKKFEKVKSVPKDVPKSHNDDNGENIFRMSLGKFQMTANCYRWSNVVYMLMLHSKCCINAPIGSRSNTWSGKIWNVPNLLLAGKWWVPSTRAYNVLKMFSLVSRPPRPQCQEVLRPFFSPCVQAS